MVSRNTPMSACGDDDTSAEPIFEMVVLGSGGGPLETDSSGYLLKPYKSSWEDGIVAIEGGSGLGALTDLIERQGLSRLFPTLNMPETHNSPILQAGYIFSLLSCYLITHAHLDHCLSLILMSGSIPPRPPLTASVKSRDSNGAPLSPPPTSRIPKRPPPPPAMPQPPVYATRKTLERLSKAYGGEIWPELGTWASESSGKPLAAEGSIAALDDSSSRKRRKTKVQDSPPTERRHSVAESESDHMGTCGGCGVIFAPLQPAKVHRPLHSGLPITTLKFHVSHGCTSKGTYESSAMFIRYDPEAVGGTPSGSASAGPSEPSVPRRGSRSSSRLAQAESSSAGSETSASGRREFLFFGDVESDFRLPGEEGHDVEGRDRAREYNQAIWEEAARSWDQGRLAGIFIECSYDSARPAHLMFGHISPPGMLYELKKLAAGVKRVDGKPPLDGLRIFVTHIKESLVPHPSGKTSRERIMTELRDLESSEKTGGLGVRFVEVKRGDRILI